MLCGKLIPPSTSKVVPDAALTEVELDPSAFEERARSLPSESVVLPDQPELAPERINRPAPVLVKAPPPVSVAANKFVV